MSWHQTCAEEERLADSVNDLNGDWDEASGLATGVDVLAPLSRLGRSL
jgi:hypothetical protein